MELIQDSQGKVWKIVNDTAYHPTTSEDVINILESNRMKQRQVRLKIWYGNVETGEAWIDPEYCKLDSDIRSAGAVGYIGRSTGKIKIPLEICNARSLGGGAILDDCIIKIALARGGRVLYQHPNFHMKGA